MLSYHKSYTKLSTTFLIFFLDLFHRAIMMSGSAYSDWALVEDPVSEAVKLASSLNCSIPRYVCNMLCINVFTQCFECAILEFIWRGFLAQSRLCMQNILTFCISYYLITGVIKKFFDQITIIKKNPHKSTPNEALEWPI